jgi:hypothetical protein
MWDERDVDGFSIFFMVLKLMIFMLWGDYHPKYIGPLL